jgi:Reverse transcriptase (RNA-dependent DNA polymerase)
LTNLGVIHLFEADYNLILKIIWARRNIWNLHNKNKIHDGQAGSRPGRRSIEVVIQKEMKYMYAHLTRTQLGTMDNDAKSCYDRIPCNFAMAVSAYFGIPSCYTKLHASNLENSKFNIRTAMGASAETYTHTHQTHPYMAQDKEAARVLPSG